MYRTGNTILAYYPQVRVQALSSFLPHPIATHELLPAPKLILGEPNTMQIFGDWVGILIENHPARTTRFMPGQDDVHYVDMEDPRWVISTFVLWDYVRGVLVGVSLTFSRTFLAWTDESKVFDFCHRRSCRPGPRFLNLRL